jgi:hypothetical protein
MRNHRRPLCLVAVTVAMALPLLGPSAVASAQAKAKAGCHKTHSCKSGGTTGSGSGSGGATPTMTVSLSPNPLVETSASLVVAVVEVETSPAFAGDTVNISSSQLQAACGNFTSFVSFQGDTNDNIDLILDDDGNASTLVEAQDCAPGTSLFEADLTVAPYYTATATLDALPPQVTTTGVTGDPVSEVETGDVAGSGDSEVYAVFYVETDPVYAEQAVEISSPELVDRCGVFSQWASYPGQVFTDTPTATATLDDDGNAIFTFAGYSCAAGSSEVIADVEAGAHPTYVTTFTVLPPQVTI